MILNTQRQSDDQVHKPRWGQAQFLYRKVTNTSLFSTRQTMKNQTPFYTYEKIFNDASLFLSQLLLPASVHLPFNSPSSKTYTVLGEKSVWACPPTVCGKERVCLAYSSVFRRKSEPHGCWQHPSCHRGECGSGVSKMSLGWQDEMWQPGLHRAELMVGLVVLPPCSQSPILLSWLSGVDTGGGRDAEQHLLLEHHHEYTTTSSLLWPICECTESHEGTAAGGDEGLAQG